MPGYKQLGIFFKKLLIDPFLLEKFVKSIGSSINLDT